MTDDDADKAFAALYEMFAQSTPVKRYRTFDLKFMDGQPVFVLRDLDQISHELAIDSGVHEREVEHRLAEPGSNSD